ncbi:hypothetical protein AgCh_017172 [Apium graveolens]
MILIYTGKTVAASVYEFSSGHCSSPNCRGTRAAAEHKLGVANQSITAGFFDNNTSAKDWKEYLESLLRESKKEEATPVLHDDVVNDLIFMG